MQEATARASRIVSDMLTYSRRSASSFVPVHLADLLEEVLRLASHDYDLKTSYDFRRIQVHRDYGPGSDESLLRPFGGRASGAQPAAQRGPGNGHDAVRAGHRPSGCGCATRATGCAWRWKTTVPG